MTSLFGFSNAFLIILPFLISLLCFLFLLNIAIWIFDDTKSRESIRKSLIVLKYGLIGLLSIALVLFVIQLF